MALTKPQFEGIDQSGQTICYNGTVGASEISLPNVPDKVITSFIVILPNDGSYPISTSALQVSPDNSTCFITVTPKGYFTAKVRGSQKQIKIKSQNATVVPYEVVINYESLS
jgi:hypothetical protein